jgi:2-oxoglutarate dehydrogenase E1 component
MSHRGRLNVLAHILNKPAAEIFSEFEAASAPDLYGGSGDVKYHLGYQRNHVNEDGRFVTVTLAPNPSHLESIDPVVEGLCRGVQKRRSDTGRKRVIPVLIHGDAAFSGQGVVAETFNLSQTLGYHTGGTIHIIINNQIGFTTSTRDARSTFFPTDIAKIIPVPIIHVNGDDPEAVIHVINLALNFRQEFGRDVVIDIFCYRRHGHNEGDEPSFTHPRMYKTIKDHSSVTSLYGEGLAKGDVVAASEQEEMRRAYAASLRKALEQGVEKAGHRGSLTAAIIRENERNRYSFDAVETAVAPETLKNIGERITRIPEDFHMHGKLKRIIDARRKSILEGGSIDYSTAESLAFGTLLLDAVAVRLSGEDSGRGTFSQRHSVWWDTESDEPSPYVPLNAIAEQQETLSVYDSPLSEYSILGFEYGYSLALPQELVLWEAQFGDFSNGAQVLIDNYLVSGEAKWNSRSRLVLLLPHGYEGMGPEHSSAHLERYLMLCAEENIQVCNLTTPAQYFHLLRRQMKQTASKPLVLMTPKSLLRHKRAVSTMQELAEGHFRYVLDEASGKVIPGKVEKVCICSGKLYYDLTARREELQSWKTAILRLEQIYPFPAEMLEGLLSRYPSTATLFWVQEEPENRGAWLFVKRQMEQNPNIPAFEYVGRPASASPATGSHQRHSREHEAILQRIFDSTESSKQHGTGRKKESLTEKKL